MHSNKFERIAAEIGSLTAEKNEAYGDSFTRACNVLEELYPNGVKPHEFRDMLAIVRVIDKLFRLATRKDAFGESPWRDICGYALLGSAADESAAADDQPVKEPDLAYTVHDEDDISDDFADEEEQMTVRIRPPKRNTPTGRSLYPPSAHQPRGWELHYKAHSGLDIEDRDEIDSDPYMYHTKKKT